MTKELNHSSLVTLREQVEKGQKACQLAIGTWNGGVQLAVWGPEKGGSGPLNNDRFKSLRDYAYFIAHIDLIPDMAPGTSTTLSTTIWDMEDKKSKPATTYTLGVDEQGEGYIGISSANGKRKFIIDSPFSLTLGSEFSENKIKLLKMHMKTLSMALHAVMLAQILSGPEKRPAGGYQKSGGNSGGGKPAANSGATDSGW